MLKFLSRLFVATLLISAFACSSDDPIDDERDGQSGQPVSAASLITKNGWYSEYLGSEIKNYDLFIFKEDGSFVYYYKSKYMSYSTQYSCDYGRYSIDGDNITLQLEGESADTGTFSISSGVLKLSCNRSKYRGKFYTSSLSDLDNVVMGRSYMEMEPVEDVVLESPYRNFMYGWYSGTHCYRELTKVEMQCEHGFNGDANFKYLRFCGDNGAVSPNGAVVIYSRPNYEGIDKYWSDGTYTIKRGGGYYTYAMHPYFDGTDYISSEDSGVLTIKSSGKYKVIDYKSDLLRIHFEGTFQD